MQYTQINNKRKQDFVKNLEDILDQEKQSINVNNQLHLTVTLAMTCHKKTRGANPYFRFGYGPQKNFNHTQGQVSGSMKDDTV